MQYVVLLLIRILLSIVINVSLIKAHCSTQTGKFVLQEPQGGPSEKRPVIELMSLIIKLALLDYAPL